MTTPPSLLTCLACRERPRRCRGLCERCHTRARKAVASGQTTWAQLQADGLALPAQQTGSGWRGFTLGRPPVTREDAVKTQGEVEAAISEGVKRFAQEYMGRGPRDIRAHLLGDLVVVRLQGVLTAAEEQLVKALPAEKGRDLLKQVRTHLVETARPLMEAMIQQATGSAVVSVHHDISTATGEEVLLFTLADRPVVREARGGR